MRVRRAGLSIGEKGVVVPLVLASRTSVDCEKLRRRLRGVEAMSVLEPYSLLLIERL